ncbi:hypothetical protein ACFLXU_03265 [Chloroflexota bacterium]
MKRKDLPEWEAKIEGGYYRASRWRLTTKCHGNTISDRAVKVRIPYRELKWETMG